VSDPSTGPERTDATESPATGHGAADAGAEPGGARGERRGPETGSTTGTGTASTVTDDEPSTHGPESNGVGPASEAGAAAGTARGDAAAAADGVDRTTVRRTRRWRGVVGACLLAVAVGVLAKRPSLLLVAAACAVFAAYPRVTAVPSPELSVRRRVEPAEPEPGDPVAVRTTVRNDGDATLFDLRIVDGVPATLSVEEGSPRRAASLGPGEEAVVAYELGARPGRHRFGPATLLCRDAAGAIEVETTVAVAGEVDCAAEVPTVPLRRRSRHRTGPLVTDDTGSGLEFHSVEEYERGDPASRIDWRRFARTGELTSVSFRSERLADVVVCVDARPAAYRAPEESAPHAVARAVDAAGRIGDGLFGTNHRVGLAGFGRGARFLPPESGGDHAERFRRTLAGDPAFSLAPPPAVRTTLTLPGRGGDADAAGPEPLDDQLAAIRAGLGSDAQLILVTPLCDEAAHRIARRFEAGGAAVTVVSPDVTTDRTPGARLVRLERDRRLSDLRNAGIPAVDWDPEAPLGAALAAAEVRTR